MPYVACRSQEDSTCRWGSSSYCVNPGDEPQLLRLGVSKVIKGTSNSLIAQTLFRRNPEEEERSLVQQIREHGRPDRVKDLQGRKEKGTNFFPFFGPVRGS